MKVYIQNLKPAKINYNKLSILDKYLLEQKSVVEIYSEEGMYLVENKKVFKMLPINETSEKITLSDMELIVDGTIIVKEIAFQLPFNHYPENTEIFTYKIKNIRLFVEGKYEENIVNPAKVSKIDKYCNFVTTNFYFEICKNELFDPYVKNELNVFLSLLN